MNEVDGDAGERLQLLLRETNDRLQRLAENAGPVTVLQLICECGECTERIDLPASAYLEARLVPSRLIVKNGHANGFPPVWEGESASVVERGSDGR